MTDENAERSSKRGKAVILGASGFIGVNLADLLARRGYDLTCFSRRPSPYWPEGATVILGDLSAPPPVLLGAMEDAVVFHLTSTTRPSNATTGAASEINDNVAATLDLLEASKDVPRRWVFASSGGTVYGQTGVERISEDHPNRPISSYGITKLAIERYFDLYHILHGLDYVTARISNPYGPFQSATTGQGLIAALFDRISRDKAVEIWGDGENVRDYIYIEDAVEALNLLAERGRTAEVYNVGSGSGASVNELVEKIAAMLGRPAALVHTPARGVDVRRNVLDTTKIGRELGWHPTVSLSEGLLLTRNWLGLQSADGRPLQKQKREFPSLA
jgi:UDP-glucose 4-epimerase